MTLCSIHSVAFGGEGIAKVDGLAIFVPFTLPNETVEVEIHQKKRNFAKAHLQKIIKPNPDRITPPCPYFFKCGGCQLQHASYPLQLQLKKRFIEDALTRIGNIHYPVPDVIPSSLPFGYRRHVSLKLKLVNNLFKLGFTALDGSHLPIYSCLLLESDQQDPIFSFLQDTFSQLDPLLPLSDSSIKILKHSQKHYLIACNFASTLPPSEIEHLKKALNSFPLVKGWILKTPKQFFESGDTSPHFIHNKLIFNYAPFGFVQNHEEQSGNIYDWIVKKNDKSKKILDLYCGIGASSLLLAQEGKQVLGIELNPLSVELAIKNAEQNLINNIEFLCASAEESTRKALHSFKPDGLVVNPPKAGIFKEILQDIVKASPNTITYISCNPPTLARDLSFLLSEGFELQDLQAFDMFPQTTHVETAAHLVRKT